MPAPAAGEYHTQADVSRVVADEIRLMKSQSSLSPQAVRAAAPPGEQRRAVEEARAAVRISLRGESARVSIAPAPLRNVFVMRHGLKETNSPSRDNLELPLTAEGLGGLASLRACLDARGVRFDAVLTSPFRRCLDTAAALQPSGQHIVLEPGLSELITDAHGLRDGSGGAATLSTLRERIQQLVGAAGGPAPLVGTDELERDEKPWAQLKRRTFNVARRMLQRYPSGCLLLVGHGASCRAVSRAVLKILGDDVRATNCRLPEPQMGALTHLVEGTDGGWRVVGRAIPELDKASGEWRCVYTAWTVGDDIGQAAPS